LRVGSAKLFCLARVLPPRLSSVTRDVVNPPERLTISNAIFLAAFRIVFSKSQV